METTNSRPFVIYRISENSYNKDRITDKLTCFMNFVSVCGAPDVIIADNISEKLTHFLQTEASSSELIHVSLGKNSHSFKYCLEFALEMPRETIVYFVEDDYLHRGVNTLEVLSEPILEGIADYVTLYDHPDKYEDGGGNPYIQGGGEYTKVLLTKSSHWKYTNSTTMTFAGRVSTLLRDRAEIEAHLDLNTGHPHDFQMWEALRKDKKRRLVSSIPGLATHTEQLYLSPLFEWRELL